MSEPCVALVPIFHALSAEQQREVAAFARPLKVDRGATLVRAGEAQARLFVVHAGRVKASRTFDDGRETILQLLGPGEVAGEVSFLTGDAAEQDYVAMEPVRVCVFEHQVLDQLIRKYPDIAMAMLRSLAERLASAKRMLAARTLADVGARVAAYLLDQPGTWSPGGGGADRVLSVVLPLAKKDVATWLGTSPETLSRRLAALEEAGLIEVNGPRIDILDPAGLDQRARGV